MNEENNIIWKAKTAAWTHDPAEKALVLLRDPTGHERGTASQLRKRLFGPGALPAGILEIVKRSDQWAAAADRPQFPREADDGPYAKWTQVRFDQHPVLIHPMSGESYHLNTLAEVNFEQIKAVSFDHFDKLIVENSDGSINHKKTFLRFWREGPESPTQHLGHLWRLLPADTRVPDHSIWEHLCLVSAFAGAMAADPAGEIALLKMTIGPVQGFIAQSRSSSDLWAGSHFLSRLLWTGLEILCDRLGPDAVIFPDLHGIAIADVWLESQQTGFKYRHLTATDENPLFSAALPNLFVAIVPLTEASRLAEDIQAAMRAWVVDQARNAASRVLQAAGGSGDLSGNLETQIVTQLAGFPEVYWSIVPWNLTMRDGVLDTSELTRVMKHFYPAEAANPGFLSTPVWKCLSREITIGRTRFFNPNPGVLYPALYDLLDRSLAVAKSTRPFKQLSQEGYRCSLCGEREWLTPERAQLEQPRGSRGRTIWKQVEGTNPSWAKKGEHLCALCTLKRLWPTLFVEEVKSHIHKDVDRFIVSTHAMAMAPTLEKIIDTARAMGAAGNDAWRELVEEVRDYEFERAALPSRLYDKLCRDSPEIPELYKVVTRLPLALDRAAEAEDDTSKRESEQKRLAKISAHIKKFCRQRPERYYALVLMDGDRMGAWISGTDEEYLLEHGETWHPQISSEVEKLVGYSDMKQYFHARRTASPARHVAISRCLNAFSTSMARIIVEDAYIGKLIYAGGDDLLAMVSVRDFLDVLHALRCCYSGMDLTLKIAEGNILTCRRGHALLNRSGKTQLFRLMGNKATASIGAVVAHYSTPLGSVLRELRLAELSAKKEGGRDAFSITLMKRSGGSGRFTANWHYLEDARTGMETASIQVLRELRNAFAQNLTRQAAYKTTEWLNLLARDCPKDQLKILLARQFRQHANKKKAGSESAFDPNLLADRFVAFAASAKSNDPVTMLRSAINLAEFLAREGRA